LLSCLNAENENLARLVKAMANLPPANARPLRGGAALLLG
jgi:hypothetical protein